MLYCIFPSVPSASKSGAFVILVPEGFCIINCFVVALDISTALEPSVTVIKTEFQHHLHVISFAAIFISLLQVFFLLFFLYKKYCRLSYLYMQTKQVVYQYKTLLELAYLYRE